MKNPEYTNLNIIKSDEVVTLYHGSKSGIWNPTWTGRCWWLTTGENWTLQKVRRSI